MRLDDDIIKQGNKKHKKKKRFMEIKKAPRKGLETSTRVRACRGYEIVINNLSWIRTWHVSHNQIMLAGLS